MLYDALIAPFLEFEFMRRALAAVVALSLGAAPIGVFLMLRRMSLVGDAMAHAILPGAAVGFLLSGLNLFAMTAGGLIAGFAVALLAGVVARVTDLKVLETPMTLVDGPVKAPGGLEGTGSVYLINHNADDALVTLRYRFASSSFDIAEEPFESGGHKFNRGSYIIRNVASDELAKAGTDLGLRAYATDTAPTVKTHAVRAPRIAMMHTWLGTQAEGWWRVEFDRLKVPYSYISTQTVANEADLRSKYDVIVFAPGVRGNPLAIINGLPMFGKMVRTSSCVSGDRAGDQAER